MSKAYPLNEGSYNWFQWMNEVESMDENEKIM
jgi:hypothetical protein